MKTKAKKITNEMEWQGQILEWLNVEIKSRAGLGLDKATQEKPHNSGQRSDLIVWKDRSADVAFLAIELKTPTTDLSDVTLFYDAIEKAQSKKAPYFAIWNMREAELYPTPPVGGIITPAAVLKRWTTAAGVTKVEDWLKADIAKALRVRAIEILEAAWGNAATGGSAGQVIDAEIFVARLGDSITQLREILYREIASKSPTNKKLRSTLNKIAVEQGFKGFVENIEFAIAGQMGYRLIGQILFYFALRRKQPILNQLTLPPGAPIPASLQPFWNDVRRYDYEALFKPEPLDSLVAIPDHGQIIVRTLIEHLGSYDWASLSDDVLGAVFERLIPREEQMLLGQFYTPRPVADFLTALTMDGERPFVLDPGCGSGTFLMSAYDYLADQTGLPHQEILSLVWGFDLSPFAAELAAINLFRQDLSHFENFPRIVPGNFFDRTPGESIDFPPPRITPGGVMKVPVPIPQFGCIVGNPPYLRSQNQDDLDPAYRNQLFGAAARAHIKASPKTDLFAFFIYHALRFMGVGSRLGFVTPASWLGSDYAVALQHLLMHELQLVAIVSSSAESFFPQVDVNAVLLVAERVEPDAAVEGKTLRFVNLKQPINVLTAGTGRDWARLNDLVDSILDKDASYEDPRLRIKLVSLSEERTALANDPSTPRNWSKFLRAPLSYYQLFGGVA